jgi:hypothetical protein
MRYPIRDAAVGEQFGASNEPRAAFADHFAAAS